MVFKGCRWQVGDGKTIKIWQDNWIPRESYFRVLSPPPREWDVETTVDKLFVADLQQWNVGLMCELFSQEEVEKILSIPLSFRMILDRRIWHFERNGKFLVKSAYHVARALTSVEGVSANGSTMLPDDGWSKLLRKLWNACVSGKVKICASCVCMDALPTKSNLSKR